MMAAGTNSVRLSARPTVLVIEDDADIRELLRYNLEQENFAVEQAADGAEALRLIERRVPELLILDLMLPGMPGLELCRKLRNAPATAALPILILTARGEEVDRVLGLEMGADDYVVKPFSPRELLARIKGLLRRARAASEPQAEGVFERGRLRIDFGSYQVLVDGRVCDLSVREFELLKFFVQHPGRVYRREQLLDIVWGHDVHVEPRTVDVLIRRLRRQVERDDNDPELILTVRGVGYRFNPDPLG